MESWTKNLPTNLAFRVPYHPGVTEKEMQSAAKILLDYEQSADQRRQKQLKNFAAALQQRREKIRALLGGENYFALNQYKQELRLDAIRKRRPPYGLGMTQADLARHQTERVAAFLLERGIQPEAVRTAVQHLWDGLSFPSATQGTQVTGKLHLGEAQLPPSPNPWITFTPPFVGFMAGTFGSYDPRFGFDIQQDTIFHDVDAGHVGVIKALADTDAGDSDWIYVKTDSQITFWFQAPVAGLVELIIEAQCGQDRHQLHLENEWGFSDSSTVQRNWLMMQVLHPNVREPTLSLASEFRHNGDDDVSFDEQHVLPGQTVWTDPLISFGPIPAGEPVLIRAGSLSEDRVEANDMKVWSTSTYSWFIKGVHVRILE